MTEEERKAIKGMVMEVGASDYIHRIEEILVSYPATDSEKLKKIRALFGIEG